ncbi:amidohydrolase [Telluribacter sp.]|jgi:aminobenzoyl-glutamate utilization protein B|uniref:amidohydrolase n=1 Tax=Telluribacter sp. TaxID=1978767 RepID=UPI002E1580BB|nr:amidohydrolase [Telluribacter sp.]
MKNGKEWLLGAALFASFGALGQAPTESVLKELRQNEMKYGDAAQQIWNFAEVGYQEEKSSALLQNMLRQEGFTVQAGVAGIPTAFVATFGQGQPVIGILAEYDALPGLSQEAKPTQKALKEGAAGHACGHHLFGVGSVASAVATKNWLVANKHPGTIKLYGTPAEEGGSGKVYMVREGLFDGVDAVLHWHPGSDNSAAASSSLANISAKFRFRGVAAHAAASPERGRSALDGVEAMNFMINMMREHIPADGRIHYIITSGGKAPNVVPDYAEVYYYARHPNREVVKDMWARMVKASEGAALGTGTSVEHEIIGGVHELLPLDALAKVMDANLRKVGGIKYDESELAFARQIHPSFGPNAPAISSAATVQPYALERTGMGSTDVGDVSWTVPTVGLRTATWVPGTAAHSWQAVAAGGTSIGRKGMLVAAQTLALTAIDLFQNPKLLSEAKAEFEQKRGKNFKYEALLGNRPPALDYRK